MLLLRYISVTFCVVMLCSTSFAAKRKRDASSSSSLSKATISGAASEDCFRGYPIGSTYSYDFVTNMHIEKTVLEGTTNFRSHRREAKVELSLVITPLNEDARRRMNFGLEVTHVHIMDKAGWESYDGSEDGRTIDPSAAEAQLLEQLQGDFYFTQDCNMDIVEIHHADDERKYATNLKTAAIRALSHKLQPPGTSSTDKVADEGKAKAYHRTEKDHMGSKRVSYEHAKRDASDPTALTVTTRFEGARPIPMPIRSMPSDHHVDLDHSEHRRTVFRDGVVQEVTMREETRFPGKDLKDELLKDMEEAEERYRRRNDPDFVEPDPDLTAKASQSVEQWTFGETSIKLVKTGSRVLKRGEKRTVRTFAEYLKENYDDDEVTFVTRDPHLQWDPDSGVGRGPEDSRSLDELLEALLDEEEAGFAWREIYWRARTDEVLLDNIGEKVRTGEDVSERARHELISVLGHIGGRDQVRILLETALDSSVDDRTKHYVFFTMTLIKKPSRDVVEDLEALLKDDLDLSEAFGKNLVLTYGTLANNLHHQGEVQRAHDMRELLLSMLLKGVDLRVDHKAVYVFALNNTLVDVDMADTQLNNITMGKWLSESMLSFPSDDYLMRVMGQSRPNDRTSTASEVEYVEEELVSALGAEAFDVEYSNPASGYARRRHEVKLKRSSVKPSVDFGAGSSGWAKWYEGWSVTSLEDDFLATESDGEGGQQFASQQSAIWDHKSKCSSGDATSCPNRDENGNGMNGEGEQESKGILPECKGTWPLDGTSCKSKMYDNWVPKNPQKEWVKKVGSGKFYAMLEAHLHMLMEVDPLGLVSQFEELFRLEFFAGAQFSAGIMGKKVPILGAYARANVSTGTRDTCGWFSFGLYYYYFQHIHFFGLDLPDCQYVDSTCKPWMPMDRSKQGYMQFLHEVIFSLQIQFAIGPIPCVFFLECIGEVGMYYSIDMIFAPAKTDQFGNELGGIHEGGGTMITGLAEPEGKLELTAELGIGVPVFSFGLGIKLTLLRVSVPITVGLNFITLRPCMGIGLRVGALGGEFYAWVRFGICTGWVKICIKITKTLYKWKGLSWECPILRRDCCKPCPGACNNGWCNYALGHCQCNDHWGGRVCQMECPLLCDYSLAPNANGDPDYENPGVDCFPIPDPDTLAFATCSCKYGYFGWNCLIACPGMVEPGEPCNNNGFCGEFGQQDLVAHGAEDRFDATLVGACQCYENFFAEDCSVTCPKDEDGNVCKGGGVCVYDGSEARCECLKGYAGPECEAKCPLFRGSPCGLRGSCIYEDGKAKCHCEFGFSGEGCEIVDERGSGRSIKFNGPDSWTVKFEDAARVNARRSEYTTGFWFKVTQVNGEAHLFKWKWGRFVLLPADASGGPYLEMCDARDNIQRDGCLRSELDVPLNEWQFVFGTTSAFTLSNDKHLWHGVRAVSGGCAQGADKQSGEYSEWCVHASYFHENSDFISIPSVIEVGEGLYGEIDNMMIFKDRPNTALVNERAHHMLSAEDPDMLFYCHCDEGRGDVVYDQVNMIAGRFKWKNESYDYSLAGPEAIWGNPSGVEFLSGAMFSNTSDVFNLDPDGAEIHFWTRMDGGRTKRAFLRFKYAVPIETLCDIEITHLVPEGEESAFSPQVLTVKSAAYASENKRYNGEGEEIIELGATSLQMLREVSKFQFKTGFDRVKDDGNTTCLVAIDEAFVHLSMPATTTTMEFTGKPSAFVEFQNHPQMKLPFTIEMWLIRPPLLHSQRGLLLSLVANSWDPKSNEVDGPFLLYETGFPRYGIQIQFASFPDGDRVKTGGWTNPNEYIVPLGEWVHFAVTGEPSGNATQPCEFKFYINGKLGALGYSIGSGDGHGEVVRHPDAVGEGFGLFEPNYCDPTGFFKGWGDANYKLRIGSKFMGQINDLIIWDIKRTQEDILQNMNIYKPMADLTPAPNVLLAIDFANVQNGGPENLPVIVQDAKPQGTKYNGMMTDGAHLGLIRAVPTELEHCPGVTYQEPERVCGADIDHGHGECQRPRRGPDQRERPFEERDRTMTCKCNYGYLSGITGDCGVECLGGWRNPCNGHGECIGNMAEILNPNRTLAVDIGGPNEVDATDTGDLTSCACERGYVGEICQFECPCWTDEWNRPQRTCAGYGYCNYTGEGSYCVCFDVSQRNGQCCEYAQGTAPDMIATDCGPCDGPGEICSNGFCTCKEGYFRVFGTCQTGFGFDVEDNTGRTVGAVIGSILLLIACVSGAVAVYFLKLRERME